MQDIPRKKGKREDKKKRAPVHYGIYRLSIREWLLYGAAGVGLCGLCAYIFYRSAAAFLILLPFGMLFPLSRRESLRKKRLRRLSLEFKDGIQILSSYLGAGYSLENAIAMSAEELRSLYGPKGMIATEFEELAEKTRMNRPVEEGLLDLGERSGLEDACNFAQVVAAAKRRGGGLVELIGQTAGIIRDKIQVQEEIHTMTAAKVLEQQVMSAVPFLIVLYIDLTSPGFFDSMYETEAGRLVMTCCLGTYGAAVILAGRILDIEI